MSTSYGDYEDYSFDSETDHGNSSSNHSHISIDSSSSGPSDDGSGSSPHQEDSKYDNLPDSKVDPNWSPDPNESHSGSMPDMWDHNDSDPDILSDSRLRDLYPESSPEAEDITHSNDFDPEISLNSNDSDPLNLKGLPDPDYFDPDISLNNNDSDPDTLSESLLFSEISGSK